MPGPTVVIVNGKIAGEPDVKAALERLATIGPVEIRVTEREGDARRYAGEAAEASAARVVAFGGDGTLNAVVSGLAPHDGPAAFSGDLGIVPTGTANDFATCAGISGDSPLEIVAALSGYRPVALDLGRVTLGDTQATFLNVATAGFGSEVSSDVPEALKAVLGRVAYLVAGIASADELEPREATIVGPGFDRRLAFFLLAIGNARCAGGGMPVCPDADPTDGLFDVTIVPEGTVGATVAEIVQKGLQGVGDAGIRLRVPWIEVRAEQPLQVNLDGEPSSATEFRFEVRPRVLKVLLPPDSPLLTTSG